MKKAIILALSLGILSACENKQRTDSQILSDSLKVLQPTSDKFPVMQIDSQSVDLVKIYQGVVHPHEALTLLNTKGILPVFLNL